MYVGACLHVYMREREREREREGRVVFSKPKAKGEEGKKKHVAWSNNKARESMSHVARRYQITS